MYCFVPGIGNNPMPELCSALSVRPPRQLHLRFTRPRLSLRTPLRKLLRFRTSLEIFGYVIGGIMFVIVHGDHPQSPSGLLLLFFLFVFLSSFFSSFFSSFRRPSQTPP